jgi:hypothetical protein
MAGKPKNELSEKHWQALKLIEEGVSRKEVASRMGWGPDYLKKLCCGDVQAAGTAADLFKKQIIQIEEKLEEESRILVKHNSLVAQEQVKRILHEINSKKKLTYDDKKTVASLTGILNNSTPKVSIGNLSYSYTQGLSAEDLLHEFTRLKSIAESSFNRSPHGNTGSGEAIPIEKSLDSNVQGD